MLFRSNDTATTEIYTTRHTLSLHDALPISRHHRVHGGDLIWEIGSGYFGCCGADGSFSEERFAANARDPQVKMIEVKLSQGAKPGHGGVLPGPKVTLEIAEARHVQPWVDCVSPASPPTDSSLDRKSTRLNSSHALLSRMPSSA